MTFFSGHLWFCYIPHPSSGGWGWGGGGGEYCFRCLSRSRSRRCWHCRWHSRWRDNFFCARYLFTVLYHCGTCIPTSWLDFVNIDFFPGRRTLRMLEVSEEICLPSGLVGGIENRGRRPRSSTPPKGPGECKCTEKTMFDRYYCIKTENGKHLLHFALFLALFCFAFSPMSHESNFHGLCSF